MNAQLELGLNAQREVAEAMAERFAERDDERSMELLDSLLSIQIDIMRIFNDLFIARSAK
jgi:hypothetical protein